MAAFLYSQILLQAGSRHTPTVWQLAPFFWTKQKKWGRLPPRYQHLWPPTTTKTTILMMAPDNVPLPNPIAPLGKPPSEEHRREIVEGSSVHPSRLEGRYFTLTAEEARALGFSKTPDASPCSKTEIRKAYRRTRKETFGCKYTARQNIADRA